MNFKAAIFDLDGTLLDTLQDLADSMNYVLESQGLPIHEREKYKYFVGNGLYNLVKRTLPPDRREESYIRYCHGLLKEEYAKRWADTTKPYEGIPELLDKFTALKYRLAILSNKPHEFTKLVVEKFLSHWNFEVVFGEREGVPRKPDPAGAIEIAELWASLPMSFCTSVIQAPIWQRLKLRECLPWESYGDLEVPMSSLKTVPI